MRQMVRSLGIFCLVLSVGCGHEGGSPTGPVSGRSAVLVLDGRTDGPIPSLSGVLAVEGQALNLSAEGFLALKTVYRGTPILLWPNDAILPVSATRALVYQDKDPGLLVRWPDGVTRMGLLLDSTLQSTPWARSRTEAAAAVVSRAHLALDVAVGRGGEPVDVIYNPSDNGFVTYPNAAMLAYVRYGDSGVVLEARIVVRSLDVNDFWYGEQNFQTAMTHEIIHTTGLIGHLSAQVKGTMSATADTYSFPEPTVSEVVIMKLHYARRVGTTLTGEVENDGGRVVMSRLQGAAWHLVCAR